MLNITIIAIGKIKDPHWLAAADGFIKRSQIFARVRMIELKAEPFGSNDHEKAKNTEGERIMDQLRNIDPDDRVVVLEESGRHFDSLAFARMLDDGRHYIFIIGGALGLSETVRRLSDSTLSLSAMTFPHELARVMLLEQIYRSGTIISGKTYHY